jgi:hypothetical protein
MVMEHIVVPLVNLNQNHVSIPLLITKLETLAPSWAISNALAWEKLVVSYQI